jgi:hypothetical protein
LLGDLPGQEKIYKKNSRKDLPDFWKSGKVSLNVSLKGLTHPADGARGDG